MPHSVISYKVYMQTLRDNSGCLKVKLVHICDKHLLIYTRSSVNQLTSNFLHHKLVGE